MADCEHDLVDWLIKLGFNVIFSNILEIHHSHEVRQRVFRCTWSNTIILSVHNPHGEKPLKQRAKGVAHRTRHTWMLFSSKLTHASPILFLSHGERPLVHRAEGRFTTNFSMFSFLASCGLHCWSLCYISWFFCSSFFRKLSASFTWQRYEYYTHGIDQKWYLSVVLKLIKRNDWHHLWASWNGKNCPEIWIVLWTSKMSKKRIQRKSPRTQIWLTLNMIWLA